MNIRSFVLSEYQSNCYVVESNGQGLIIDPGAPSDEVLNAVKDLQIKYIVNTHAHPDHVNGNAYFKEHLNVPVAMPELDVEMYKIVAGRPPDEDDWLYADGDVVEVGNLKFDILHTPGHCSGHCILIERQQRVIFVGDLVFMGSIGRTDLPSGSDAEMEQSLQKLVNLEGDWELHSGHGPVTTLDNERKTNPFLTEFR